MITIEKRNDGYIKIKTKDGDIEIYYEEGRTCVSYTDLSDYKSYMFTLKDGEHLLMDGT